MALLNSKFDVTRGYPNGSAKPETFLIKKTGSPLAPVSIPQGSIVTQELQGTDTVVDLATTPDITLVPPIDVYLVVEGNDDYSGEFTEKVATVKVNDVTWKTEDYAAGAYTPGTPVSFSAGVIKVAGATDQIIGYVKTDLTASEGVVEISA